MSALSFFRAWLTDPRRVGAIVPSSVALADAITTDLTSAAAPVIELGPGTGVFTRSIIAGGIPEHRLALIEGNEASQFGIGMVSARIAEAVLRDERVVFPIGAFNAECGVTLSLPSIVGRQGVSHIFEPAMSEEERQALRASAQVLRKAVQRTSRSDSASTAARS